jgi:DNA-binding Lrp family transcriptional regulator
MNNQDDNDLLSTFENLSVEDQLKMARALIKEKKINASTNTVFQEDKEKSISFAQPYVFAFTSNFRVLAELDISKNELRVLTYIIEKMDFGNLINLSQSVISKDLNISSGNMSNLFKKLKQKGILVLNDGHLYINSNIFAKGMSHQLDQNRKENLKAAKSTIASIESYPDNYSALSKKERRSLDLSMSTKEIYTDAFVFAKNKKNNAKSSYKNVVINKKPRNTYLRTKENEAKRLQNLEAENTLTEE